MKKRRKQNITIIIGFLNLVALFSMAQNPICSFSTNQSSGCSPLAVQFTNTSSNATSYYWDFGNGNTSVLTNPSNVYSSAGTYTIKLIATGANGQKDSVLSNNLITVSSSSISNYYAVNTTSCLDGNVFSFVNTSINSSNCVWDFGDGITSTIQNPSHTYLSNGNFTIKLITYDIYGCPNIKIMTNYIHVLSNPVTDYTVNTTSSCNLNQIFNFVTTTPTASAWLWDFGDGSTSVLQNPNHAYGAAGSYSVSLKTTAPNGCSDSLLISDVVTVFAPQIPVFTSSTSSGCVPATVTFTNLSSNSVSWLWNFGDSETSIEENPAHIYQNSGYYTISLTITTDNNCTYTKTLNNFISIANKAISNFSISNTGGCAPINVQFTNQSTNAVSRVWEFGDGTTSTLLNPAHTYTANGSYTVTLHSYNASGCEAISQHLNAVVVILPNANFSANLNPGCAPLTTSFTNTSTNAVQWAWDFGDGTFSNIKNPNHTYNLPGDYNVSLIALSSQGCSDTLTFNSYIHVINTSGNFTPPATINGCVPFSTLFSSITPGAVSWLWNFGDGSTSTQQNPSHTYIASGFYTVSLTIQLNGGCTQLYPVFRTFNINGGQAGFTFSTQSQCAPYIVNFTGTMSGNPSSGFWNFGDGNTSSLQNPTHTYSAPGFYTVKYTATTSEGCSSTIVKSNSVQFIACNTGGTNSGNGGGSGGGTNSGTNGITTYYPAPLNGCIPFNVQFNNIKPETISWLWNFGDGNTSTLQNPFHTYTAIGNYDVTLVAYNFNGQSDTIIYSNYIHASGINTNFSFTENNDCVNTTLSCTGISANATQWNWDFGDGTTSTLQNPIKTYPNSINNYTIKLTTINTQGCSGSISNNILITTESPAVWANKYIVCTNQQINFNCSSSDFLAYLWDFGDGTSSALQNPVHSYNSGGTYQVKLKYTEANGCIHYSFLQNLVKIQAPIANFNFTFTNGCNSQTLNFTNSSTEATLPLSLHSKWNFGDGSAEIWAENPSHIYATNGTYQITLTVDNENGCTNSIVKTVYIYPATADFSFTQNTTCFPITATFHDSSSIAASWLWEFGDGATSTLQNPVHIFTVAPTAEITLTITDVYGCKAAITKPTIAFFFTDFYASVTEGCAPMNVDFSDASFNANQWLWNFGDGTTSTLQNPNHSYLNNGIYSLSLISKSADGCSDTKIFNSINVNKPQANFISANPTNCSPALVTFTDLSSDATSWLWDFGDGSTSVNQHPGHIYNIAGLYTIKLIVTNTIGCSDTLTRIDYIKVPGPIANFNASTNQSCTGSILQFTDLSINAISWNWNFGDGNTSTLQNPTTSYQNSGQYVVSLIVFDLQGCTTNFTLTDPIDIKPLPLADFTVSDTSACTPFPVSFHNTSQNAVSYVWNFGDGGTSPLQNPIHTYLNFGIYPVSMVATSPFGCYSTRIFNSIVANKTPVADFVANKTAGCSPLMVAFSDSSLNVQNANYIWNLGNGSSSLTQNSKATYTNPGFYPVSLIITNSNGCSDTLIKTAYIEVNDFDPPAKSMIQVASVISDTSNFLSWNQSLATDFSYYEIYRKDILTGNYLSIRTINNRSIISITDNNNLNTLLNSYCYKIQTVDNCGYALPLDSLQEHCTINVTAKGISDDIRVNWTPYIGANVTTYSIYRMELGSAIPVLVGTVHSNVLTINDTTLICPNLFSYRIKANNLNGNAIFSYSDTSIAKPPYNILDHQKMDVVRSTVINNNEVLTEWKTPIIAPEKVTGYSIYRSLDDVSFSLLTTVLPSVHEYIDNNVNVNTQNYFYKIKAVNSCNDAGTESNKSSSVLLKAELIDGNTHLNWTSYEGWNMGVEYYIIEKMNEQGEWEIIKTVDGNQLIHEVE